MRHIWTNYRVIYHIFCGVSVWCVVPVSVMVCSGFVLVGYSVGFYASPVCFSCGFVHRLSLHMSGAVN